jgi:hypothetical protein
MSSSFIVLNILSVSTLPLGLRKEANNANVALARRLCDVSWYCLKENRAYEARLPSKDLGH